MSMGFLVGRPLQLQLGKGSILNRWLLLTLVHTRVLMLLCKLLQLKLVLFNLLVRKMLRLKQELRMWLLKKTRKRRLKTLLLPRVRLCNLRATSQRKPLLARWRQSCTSKGYLHGLLVWLLMLKLLQLKLWLFNLLCSIRVLLLKAL